MRGKLRKNTKLGTASIVSTALAVSSYAGVPASDSTLERLRAVDVAALTGMTLTFEMEAPANGMHPDQGATKRLCTVAQRESVRAVECETIEYPEVAYRAPGTASYQEVDYDDEGNLVVWRLASLRALMDGTTNETYREYNGIIVDRTGRVVQESATAIRSVFGASDRHDWYEVERWCWAAGLGFSPVLDSVVDQAMDEKGMIQLRANGSYGASPRGSWQLTVDPKHEFLVRSARFTNEHSDKPSIVLSTSGAKRFGDVVIPEKGRFVQPSIPNTETILHFQHYSPTGDENLLRRIREELRRAKDDDNVELMDYRENPGRPTRTRSAPPDRR